MDGERDADAGTTMGTDTDMTRTRTADTAQGSGGRGRGEGGPGRAPGDGSAGDPRALTPYQSAPGRSGAGALASLYRGDRGALTAGAAVLGALAAATVALVSVLRHEHDRDDGAASAALTPRPGRAKGSGTGSTGGRQDVLLREAGGPVTSVYYEYRYTRISVTRRGTE